MRIVMFSINPLYPDYVMGGAPLQLQKVAIHVGELGHQIKVLCTQPTKPLQPFYWHENVQVLPILPFKQPFPQPYDTPAYNIANAIHTIANYLREADRFYMHDGELLFPPVYQRIPTVVSLRDNVYPETILGGFLFQGDVLIAISDYSRQLYLNTFGRFFPELKHRLKVIHNGFDWTKYQPTPADEILQIIPVDPIKDTLILHPHRPEPSKGLYEAIAVIDILIKHYQIPNIKVLVPRWLETGISDNVRQYDQMVREEIQVRGLNDHFVFHDWVPQSLMPQYYSIGSLTFALGQFVESFGNTVYESLGCGTPAIVSRVSTHRELLPDALLDKVHYGDAESAARIASQILSQKKRTSPDTLAYLHSHYSIEAQLERYAEAILWAQHNGTMSFRCSPINKYTTYRLAPWCYIWARGVYHDFRAEHVQIPELTCLVENNPKGFRAQDAQKSGISCEQIESWYQAGYLIPVS